MELRDPRGDEGDRFKLDETMESDALLLGRVTYEGFAEAWPERDGEFAEKFNTMPKYVVSSTLEDPDVDQHDGARRRPGGGGHPAEGVASTAISWSTAAPGSCRRWSSTTWWTSCG